MVVGTYLGGRPVEYDEATGSFAVGGARVDLHQVRAYEAAGQLTWASPETAAWFASLPGHTSIPGASARKATRVPTWVKLLMPVVLLVLLLGSCVGLVRCVDDAAARDKAILMDGGLTEGEAGLYVRENYDFTIDTAEFDREVRVLHLTDVFSKEHTVIFMDNNQLWLKPGESTWVDESDEAKASAREVLAAFLRIQDDPKDTTPGTTSKEILARLGAAERKLKAYKPTDENGQLIKDNLESSIQLFKFEAEFLGLSKSDGEPGQEMARQAEESYQSAVGRLLKAQVLYAEYR